MILLISFLVQNERGLCNICHLETITQNAPLTFFWNASWAFEKRACFGVIASEMVFIELARFGYIVSVKYQHKRRFPPLTSSLKICNTFTQRLYWTVDDWSRMLMSLSLHKQTERPPYPKASTCNGFQNNIRFFLYLETAATMLLSISPKQIADSPSYLWNQEIHEPHLRRDFFINLSLYVYNSTYLQDMDLLH